LRQASLSRIICDNADNITKVPRRAFILQPSSQFVSCGTLPTVDLSLWRECGGKVITIDYYVSKTPLAMWHFRRSEVSYSKIVYSAENGSCMSVVDESALHMQGSVRRWVLGGGEKGRQRWTYTGV